MPSGSRGLKRGGRPGFLSSSRVAAKRRIEGPAHESRGALPSRKCSRSQGSGYRRLPAMHGDRRPKGDASFPVRVDGFGNLAQLQSAGHDRAGRQGHHRIEILGKTQEITLAGPQIEFEFHRPSIRESQEVGPARGSSPVPASRTRRSRRRARRRPGSPCRHRRDTRPPRPSNPSSADTPSRARRSRGRDLDRAAPLRCSRNLTPPPREGPTQPGANIADLSGRLSSKTCISPRRISSEPTKKPGPP